MIRIKDVITMRVPFPDISSQLAVRAHMYACINVCGCKEMLKCQTFKPYHLLKKSEPRKFIIENPDSTRNPFNRKTVIDCDKSFTLNHVRIDLDLLASRSICDDLFNSLCKEIKHSNFKQVALNASDVTTINRKIFAAS